MRQRLAIVIAHPHKPLPPSFIGFTLRPCFWSLHGRPRQPSTLQNFQSATDDLVLHVRIPGLSTGIPKRKVNKQEAWNTAFLDDVPGGPDDNRRNAGGLKMSRDQTHGLVADGSKRNEEGDIDTILAHPRLDLRGILFECESLAVVRRNAVEPRAE